MWIWGPRVADWGFWAEGENPRDVGGGPGLEVLVPGFGIRVLDEGWGPKAGDGGPGMGVGAPAPKPAVLSHEP